MIRKINILIFDENPDFAKSLGFLLNDFLGNDTIELKYVYNIKDGLELINHTEFNFMFSRATIADVNTSKINLSFKEVSLNPSVKIIELSTSNDYGLSQQFEEASQIKFPIKKEVDANELAFVLGFMK